MTPEPDRAARARFRFAGAARARFRFARAAAVIGAVGLALTAPAWGTPAEARPVMRPPTFVVESTLVAVGAEPDGSPVSIDTTTYRPAPDQTGARYPAILLAHGFGGTKSDLAAQAEDLAEAGYVVLTYTARGFGRSTGRIHLNDPDYEVRDARVLVDRLAADPQVLLDGPSDPRVGAAGGSYGGALSLMLAGSDRRVDAVAALITWNDLADAFFPQAAQASSPAAGGAQPKTPAQTDAVATPGPFKQLWASRFFGASLLGNPSGPARGAEPVCGRFDEVVCRLFLAAAETGEPSSALLDILHRHSPKPTLADVRAPTLLIQGMGDSLFGVDQADATARALAAAGVTVAMRWMDGGHDGTSSTAESDAQAVRDWLATHVRDRAANPDPTVVPVPGFVWSGPLPRRAATAPLWSVAGYPGIDAGPTRWVTVPMADPGAPRTVLTPPGGQPASTTFIPGAGAFVGTGATYPLAALPGQSAAFDTTPMAERLDVVGSPRVRLSVRSTGAVVTIFVSLWQVAGQTATLPRRLVAPARVTVSPGEAIPVEVALPAAAYTFDAGSTWRVLVTSTDSAYANVREARIDQVTLAEPTLVVPVLTGSAIAESSAPDVESRGVIAATLVLLVAGALSALWRRRREHRVPPRPDLTDVPLAVEGLVQTYADGHRAVNDVSWRAEKGQVVGLLGPNGAGKTTTLRMVMGLISPDSGSVHVLGETVHAGADVLRRVGALIEGPGFLPHLTGRQNLTAFWAATGRPESEAGYADVLSVAALGGAVDRPVRSYSHGMKQRLGIAQAMLGMPDLLVLDEPTNGLDPPQIAAMRPILRAYADTGRTVVVSSHLLAEVEMTCSHVVVMHAGRVVAAGSVAELVGSADTSVVDLHPSSGAVEVATRIRGVAGIRQVDVSGDRLVIEADLHRADVVSAVVGAGGQIDGVSSRRHLEEVFLGVIAGASGVVVGAADEATGEGSEGSGGSGGTAGGGPGAGLASAGSMNGRTSLVDRLRQVRSR